jgi:hypothetical protein
MSSPCQLQAGLQAEPTSSALPRHMWRKTKAREGGRGDGTRRGRGDGEGPGQLELGLMKREDKVGAGGRVGAGNFGGGALHAVGSQDELSVATLQDGAGLEPKPAARLWLVIAGCSPAATHEAHEVLPRPPASLKWEGLKQGAGLRVPPVFVSSSVRCSPPRV